MEMSFWLSIWEYNLRLSSINDSENAKKRRKHTSEVKLIKWRNDITTTISSLMLACCCCCCSIPHDVWMGLKKSRDLLLSAVTRRRSLYGMKDMWNLITQIRHITRYTNYYHIVCLCAHMNLLQHGWVSFKLISLCSESLERPSDALTACKRNELPLLSTLIIHFAIETFSNSLGLCRVLKLLLLLWCSWQ